MSYEHDQRIVLTLDAGGTNFVFAAIAANQEIVSPITLPSNGHDLSTCLETIIAGFKQVKAQLRRSPVAISIAFPGPADYPLGIIDDLINLPCFRGGIALGPMLERIFKIPVFLNNDGDLFVYGESMAGFLPAINGKLAAAGSPKRYKNLIGVTLGTGFGCGIATNGLLYLGDNSAGAEIWAIRNKIYPHSFAEEGASIRGVQKAYARQAYARQAYAHQAYAHQTYAHQTYARRTGLKYPSVPAPKEIYEIARGNRPGDQAAALAAFREMGEIVGDALANTLTLLDGLIVIGGGLAGAAELFLQTVVDELNGTLETYEGEKTKRTESKVFNLEDEIQLQTFLRGEVREITIPYTNEKIRYDPLKRVGVGLSRLGTSQAIALGAYAFALKKLDQD